MYIMAFWQFIVIAVLIGGVLMLIGGLLLQARSLVNRVGSTNETLKRIEEALLAAAAQPPGAHAPVTAPEVSRSPDISPGNEIVASYLTLRDLKVISGASLASVAGSQESSAQSAGSHPDSETTGSYPVMESADSHPDSETTRSYPVMESADSHPDSETTGSYPVMESADSLDASTDTDSRSVGESPGAVETASIADEPPKTPAPDALEEDSDEKRKQNELMFLNQQRRRRRSRAGY